MIEDFISRNSRRMMLFGRPWGSFSAIFTFLELILVFLSIVWNSAYWTYIIKYTWFCFTSYCVWTKILAPFYKSNRGPQILETGLLFSMYYYYFLLILSCTNHSESNPLGFYCLLNTWCPLKFVVGHEFLTSIYGSISGMTCATIHAILHELEDEINHVFHNK
jgi:hypothetical protein